MSMPTPSTPMVAISPNASSSRRSLGARRRHKSQVIHPSTFIIVYNLPKDYTKDLLKQMCTQYGDMLRSKLIQNLEGQPVGHIVYRTLEQAQAAVVAINRTTIGENKLFCNYGESDEKENRASLTILIKRIPPTVDVNQILHLFRRYGDITQVSTSKLGTTGNWKCAVRYQSFEAATTAVAQMDKQIVDKGSKPISVKFISLQKSNKFSDVGARENASSIPLERRFSLSDSLFE